jgi:hypothetical protein
MKALEKLVKENYDGICDGFASLVIGKVKSRGGKKWSMVIGYVYDDATEKLEILESAREILANDPRALNIKSNELVDFGIDGDGTDFDIKEFAERLERAYEANVPGETADVPPSESDDAGFSILQKLYPSTAEEVLQATVSPAPQKPLVDLKWHLAGKECFKYEDVNVVCHLVKAQRGFTLVILVKEFDEVSYYQFKTCREGKIYANDFVKLFA